MSCKRALLFLAFLILLPLVTGTAYSYTVPSDTIVYVANTGSKYHRAGCSYLLSSRSMTIAQAERSGFEPCSRCDPDVKTGQYVSNWDGESGETPSHRNDPTPIPSTEISAFQSKQGFSFPLGALIPIIAGAFIISLTVRRFIRIGNEEKRKREQQEKARLIAEARAFYKEREQKERERKRLEMEEQRRQAILKDKERYTVQYGGKSVEELAGVPSGVEVGPDGLPKVSGSDDWGSSFTFYVAPSGKSFHCIRGCSGAYTRRHAVEIEHRGYAPCKRCRPQLPSLSWYVKYCKIKELKQKYEID